jgi:hypothetical protein
MKNASFALAALACAALAACEHGQQLPFSDATPVTRAVPDSGATLSSSAGASVQLPAGSVAAGTTVTLTPSTAPAQTVSGTPAATSAFQLTPAGLSLSKPADIGLSIHRGDDAWLASVVLQSPAGVTEQGDGGIDLATGVLRGQITTLGTVQAVIPEPSAILRAQVLGSAIGKTRLPLQPVAATTPLPTRTLRGDCGAPGKRCGGLIVEVSKNLLDLVDTAAIVYPRIGGQMTISGAAASGQLVMYAPVRLRLASRANATTVPVTITATATAQTVVTETPGHLTLTNVRVAGATGATHSETLYTLAVDYSGATAYIRLSTDFTTTAADGTQQPVTVKAQIPLARGE